ncbi:2-hydroxyacid dehydrogenase [Platysternon megacephalum]|uniref:2-hydroxyacid dehydrogenase n=1 Tax=Platysternon megacephalum TaxID=55544 RepID=A0A4D9DCH3_9SAUR|nr:2-hydroxyacid dehydrogenase [Platysternon megacephalum]
MADLSNSCLFSLLCRGFPRQWWRRQRVEEFYPTVFLGDPNLEAMLNQYGLKDKAPLKRPTDAFLPTTLQLIRELSRPYTGPAVVWSLYLTAATICLLRALGSRTLGSAPSSRHKGSKRPDVAEGDGDHAGSEKNGQVRKKEAEEKVEGRARGAGDAPSDSLRSTKRKK